MKETSYEWMIPDAKFTMNATGSGNDIADIWGAFFLTLSWHF